MGKVTAPTINVADAKTTKENGYKPAIPAGTETVVDKSVYTAQFITNGQEITPGTDLPKGVFEVKVLRDETSIKDNALYGKSYAVFENSKLAQDKFPTPKPTKTSKTRSGTSTSLGIKPSPKQPNLKPVQ